jgi:hypothetical protein
MNNPTLYGQVRRKLNITWEDDETTARIEEIMESAIPDLKHKLGITDSDYDFSVAGAENTLFLAYCLYEWNHALADFDLNYERMIAQVRSQHEVAHYLAGDAYAEI